MTLYFSLITSISIILIIYLFIESWRDNGWVIFSTLLIWFGIAFLPSVVHTFSVEVTHVTKPHSPFGEHKIIFNVEKEKYIEVTDSYKIEKINRGEFIIEKHTYSDIWGNEPTKPKYFIIPTFDSKD